MNAEGICIIGAGPAGLMAAIHAAGAPAPVTILESNPTAGRKLLITGGGRCNLTHAGGPEDIARTFGGPHHAKDGVNRTVKPERFLRHCLYGFPPENVREFFLSLGLATMVKPDGCVFPVSQQATEVRDLLLEEAIRRGARIRYQSQVTDITADDNGFVLHMHGRQIAAARIILATGGLSWPQTGSSGDGYRFAAQLGHTVIPPKPALVPLVTKEAWVGELAGVSLPGVGIRATIEANVLAVMGNMLFTQRGIGGPAAQDLSRGVTDALFESRRSIPIAIDITPETDEAQADRELQQRLQAQAKKTVTNVLAEQLPRQLAQTICRLAGCKRDVRAGQLTSESRRRLTRTIKRLPLTVTGAEPIAKATVTRGGVSRDEIDPKTMESRIRPGLFFAGEVIDVDGPCGGYNLQMCWSSGALAGRSIRRMANR